MSTEVCGFDVAWIGCCPEAVPCAKHQDKRCSRCGKSAARECPCCAHMLVCGRLLCGDCKCSCCPVVP